MNMSFILPQLKKKKLKDCSSDFKPVVLKRTGSDVRAQ